MKGFSTSPLTHYNLLSTNGCMDAVAKHHVIWFEPLLYGRTILIQLWYCGESRELATLLTSLTKHFASTRVGLQPTVGNMIIDSWLIFINIQARSGWALIVSTSSQIPPITNWRSPWPTLTLSSMWQFTRTSRQQNHFYLQFYCLKTWWEQKS